MLFLVSNKLCWTAITSVWSAECCKTWSAETHLWYLSISAPTLHLLVAAVGCCYLKEKICKFRAFLHPHYSTLLAGGWAVPLVMCLQSSSQSSNLLMVNWTDLNLGLNLRVINLTPILCAHIRSLLPSLKNFLSDLQNKIISIGFLCVYSVL